jgi:hypothetical protein
MVPAATVSGTLTASGAVNVDGRLVNIYSGSTVVATASTDSSGNFYFTGLAAGTYTLGVASAVYLTPPAPVTLIAGQEIDGIQIGIQPGANIAGTVTTSTGFPVSGSTVILTFPDNSTTSVTTGSDGTYSFNQLNTGGYSVQVVGSGAPTPVTVTSLSADYTADFTQATAATLGGQLLSATGDPLQGSVTLWFNGDIIAQSPTDASGNYGFILPAAGTYDVIATSNTGSFAPLFGFAIAGGAALTEDFTAGTGTINLTLTDDGTGSVATSTVSLEMLMPDGSYLEVQNGAADSSGAVTFMGLVAGSYDLVAQEVSPSTEGGATPVTVASAATVPVSLVMAAQPVVSGIVTQSNGRPISGALVQIISETDSDDSTAVQTASDGSWSECTLPSGTYDVIVVATGFDAAIETGVVVGGSTAVDLMMTTATGTVTGRLVDAQGHPLSQGDLVVRDSAGRAVATGTAASDGTFMIAVDGSNLTLYAYAGGFMPTSVSIPTASAGTARVGDLTLASAPTAGTVTTAPQIRPAIDPEIITDGFQFAIDILTQSWPIRSGIEVHSTDFGPPPAACNLGALYNQLLYVVDRGNKTFTAWYDEETLAKKIAAAMLVLPVAELLADLGAIASAILAYGEIAGVAALSTEAYVGLTLANSIISIGGALTDLIDNIYTVATSPTPKSSADQAKTCAQEVGDLKTTLGETLNALKNGKIEALVAKDLVAAGRLFALAGIINAVLTLIDHATFTDTQKALNDVLTEADALEKLQRIYNQWVQTANQLLPQYQQALADCIFDRPSNPDPGPPDPNPKPGGGGGGGGGGYNPTPGQPNDPNDIVGPGGYGESGFVSTSNSLSYKIEFQNTPTASSPAQVVKITEQLDPGLNYNSFRLGSFGWGGLDFQVPANSAYYSTVIDLSATYGFDVDVTAGINVLTGLAFWTFTTVDPATGDPPTNLSIGFLPPDDAELDGEGFVNYSARAKSNASTGTVIQAQAQIVFDNQPPLETPLLTNTLDVGTPTSSVAALPSTESGTQFIVSWSGADDTDGSGVAAYSVYVSDDGGPFAAWLTDTTATSGQFTGQGGHSYSF